MPTTGDVAAKLERADILLTRGNGLMSSLIRYGTRSHWNHVAMVFLLGDTASGKALGYQSTFIIEAQSHGIDIHPIDKYLFNEKQDMAVLRMPANAVPAGIRDDYLRRVRGFALEEIDAGYGFGEIGGITRRLFGWIVTPVAWLFGAARLLFRTSGVSRVVNRWICSGIAQYAYYRACFGVDPKNSDFWNPCFSEAANRAGVVMNSDLKLDIERGLGYADAVARLKLTTPAHFALAATYGQLETVAERVGGQWSERLTRP